MISSKFLLTRELARLAKWLRILGFDARYEPSADKSFVMIEALKDERIVVTKNLRFGTRHGGTIIFIKHDELQEQLSDLKRETGLWIDPKKVFSRCTVCNFLLEAVDKTKIEDRVPPFVYQTHEQFMRCFGCGRIYWQGTHWGNVSEVIQKIGI